MAKEVLSSEAKKEILDESEISLVLDTYDDIFSDFDPRHFSTRALSQDFLLEAKRASRDKDGGIELRFLIPVGERNVMHESLIKQRLKEHFVKHNLNLLNDIRNFRKKAGLLIAVGACLGLIDVGLVNFINMGDLAKSAVEIILQPASWFNIWVGIEHLMFLPDNMAEEEKFYRKMAHAHISFAPY